MGAGRYTFMVIVMLVLFLSLIKIVFSLPVAKYELILTAILLFIAILTAIGVYFDNNFGYILGVIFFALNVLNLAYLYFRSTSSALVWYGLSAAVGFLAAVTGIKKARGIEVYDSEKSEEVGKEIGRIEERHPKIEIIMDEKPKKRVKKGAKQRRGKAGKRAKRKSEILKNF